jgi:hypothetical protein
MFLSLKNKLSPLSRWFASELSPSPLLQTLLMGFGFAYAIMTIVAFGFVWQQGHIYFFDWVYLLTPITLAYFSMQIWRAKPWRQLNSCTLGVFVALALLASLPRAIDVADHDIAMDKVDQIMKSVEYLKDQSLT